MFADLIDGPLAHLPSGRFAANSAWILCAAITHNLLRAAGTSPATARRGPRRHPAPQDRQRPRPLARPATPPVLHLPAHWPWARAWLHCGTTPSDTAPAERDARPPAERPDRNDRKSWADQRLPHAHTSTIKIN